MSRIATCSMLTLSLLAGPLSASAASNLFSSGTGFFVTRDGYILTNNHVIEHCRDVITVNGAVTLSPAKLVAHDAEYDLALLKTDALANDEAHLSSVKQPMRTGDPMVIVGFPGQAWQSGKTQTRESKILNTTGPHGEEKWLEFSDALAQGNSGGPLLDASGNVVGVVAAKGKLLRYNEVSAKQETVEQFDIAISLPVIRRFLEAQAVRYSEADSGIYLSSDHVTDIAHRFVVNVRCKL